MLEEIANLFFSISLDKAALLLLGLILDFYASLVFSNIFYRALVRANLESILEKYKFKEAVFGIDLLEFSRKSLFLVVFSMGISLALYFSNFQHLFNAYSYYILPKILDFVYGVYIMLIGFWISFLIREKIIYRYKYIYNK